MSVETGQDQGITVIRFHHQDRPRGRELLGQYYRVLYIWPGGLRDQDGLIYTVRGPLNGVRERLVEEGVSFESQFLALTPVYAGDLWRKLAGWGLSSDNGSALED